MMSLFGKKSLSNVRELQGDKLILRLETLQRHQEGLMKQLGLVVLSARGNDSLHVGHCYSNSTG